MANFSDLLLARYTSAAHIDELLVPVGDATRQRVGSLLAQVYQMQLLTVQSVDSITVQTVNFQVPLVEPVEIRGTWEKIIPQAERSISTFSLPALAQTTWIDMELTTRVSVRVSVNLAALEAVASEDLSELTQAQFVAKFQFIDLNSLMTATRVSTFQELQAELPRLYHLQYAQPPAYDPNDPTTQRTYSLRISVLFFPVLDVADALRQLKTGRHALDEIRPRPDGFDGGDLLSSSAWLGVFPSSVFGPPNPITQAEVSTVLAAENFVAAFENP